MSVNIVPEGSGITNAQLFSPVAQESDFFPID